VALRAQDSPRELGGGGGGSVPLWRLERGWGERIGEEEAKMAEQKSERQHPGRAQPNGYICGRFIRQCAFRGFFFFIFKKN